MPVTPSGEIKWTHSKTSFMRGKQCIKSMYLHRYKPELKTKQTAYSEHIANKGFSFEKQYQKLHFPHGIDLKQECGDDLNEILNKTNEILIEKASCTIFEAALMANNVFVLLDILRKNKDGSFDAYELKNSSEMKASFLWDASLQYYVCKAIFGEKLNSFNLVLKGRNNTFKSIEITMQAEKKQAQIIENLAIYTQVLTAEKAPPIAMGKHCNVPYECDFKGFCKKKP